ncbi:MAG TPA: ankyrin repeat domain-containing protein, partial [Coxiellaceae bacterium]|nr:ankyrin repeat domain-containing protein [Coxiellaceae bacterium]
DSGDRRHALVCALNTRHEAIAAILVEGLDVSELETEGSRDSTPLVWAAYRGYATIVNALLAKGVNKEKRDSNGSVPLILAAREGHTEAVRILLAAGANPNLVEGTCTALSAAREKGHRAIVELLLQHPSIRDEEENTALIRAVKSNNPAEVACLLADPRTDINAQNNMGETALIAAARGGHLPLLMDLLANRANVHLKNRAGESALVVAVKARHETIVRNLLVAGVDSGNCRDALICAFEKDYESVAAILLTPLVRAELEEEAEDGCLPLVWAAYRGYDAIVNVLLVKGANTDKRDRKGLFPLFSAAAHGHLGAVRLLLEGGADVNARAGRDTSLSVAREKGHSAVVALLLQHPSIRDEEENTALILAVKSNNPAEVARLLADPRTDINAQNNTGETALIAAVRGGYLPLVVDLLGNGANIHLKNKAVKTALAEAANSGHETIVRALVAAGADSGDRRHALVCALNTRHEAIAAILVEGLDVSELETEGSRDSTPLVWAAYRGYATIVNALLAKGVNKEKRDSNGLVPLILAAREGHTEVVRILLAAGADPHLIIEGICTALSAAREKGHRAIVELLLQHPSIRDEEGNTALILAVKSNNPAEVARLLADPRTDINAQNNTGETALIAAVKGGHLPLVSALLANGVSVHLRNRVGESAVLIAATEGYDAIVCALLGAGANVNERDNEGSTLLILAAARNHLKVVNALLAHPDLDINARNTCGTAILYASYRRNFDIVAALLNDDRLDIGHLTDSRFWETLDRAYLPATVQPPRMLDVNRVTTLHLFKCNLSLTIHGRVLVHLRGGDYPRKIILASLRRYIDLRERTFSFVASWKRESLAAARTLLNYLVGEVDAEALRPYEATFKEDILDLLYDQVMQRRPLPVSLERTVARAELPACAASAAAGAGASTALLSPSPTGGSTTSSPVLVA